MWHRPLALFSTLRIRSRRHRDRLIRSIKDQTVNVFYLFYFSEDDDNFIEEDSNVVEDSKGGAHSSTKEFSDNTLSSLDEMST
jgi:hypothetical protein